MRSPWVLESRAYDALQGAHVVELKGILQDRAAVRVPVGDDRHLAPADLLPGGVIQDDSRLVRVKRAGKFLLDLRSDEQWPLRTELDGRLADRRRAFRRH